MHIDGYNLTFPVLEIAVALAVALAGRPYLARGIQRWIDLILVLTVVATVVAGQGRPGQHPRQRGDWLAGYSRVAPRRRFPARVAIVRRGGPSTDFVLLVASARSAPARGVTAAPLEGVSDEFWSRSADADIVVGKRYRKPPRRGGVPEQGSKVGLELGEPLAEEVRSGR